MNPWILLDSEAPGGTGEMLNLYQRGKEFSITAGDYELMNSRVYGMEDALAKLTCARIAKRTRARILIGGLGMGYTIRTALDELGPQAQVVVAEVAPDVIEWNQTFLADLAGKPLEDPRVTLRQADVGHLIDSATGAFDAILLDIDNGPQALTRKGNSWLYSDQGLTSAFKALRSQGVLAIWASEASPAFAKDLRKAGFEVTQTKARAKGKSTRGGGVHHRIWIATRN